jgi:hypothetical protein
MIAGNRLLDTSNTNNYAKILQNSKSRSDLCIYLDQDKSFDEKRESKQFYVNVPLKATYGLIGKK